MSDPVLQARSRLANASKRNDPAARDRARQDLRAAMLERHVREAVAAAPPLTAEQRGRIAALLTGGAA